MRKEKKKLTGGNRFSALTKQLEGLGSNPGIIRIKSALRAIKRPDRKYHVIKVGGTNGKGSTATFLASILKNDGHRVGLYTSPHLKSYTERFRVNGYKISRREFVKLLEYGLEFADKFELTTFETLTFMAFVYFARQKCEYAVFEVGMGGRLDAVNVAKEIISIITNVDYDHTQQLGTKIKNIAYEKAGIVQHGPVVTSAEGKALEIIKKRAKKRRVPCLVYGKHFMCDNIDTHPHGTDFVYNDSDADNNMRVRTKLVGKYQAINAALAIKASELIGVKRISIIRGIANAHIAGRMEYIKEKLRFVIDVAHNPHGIRHLVEAINIFPYRKRICIFGVMKDKDVPAIVRLLCKSCDEVMLVRLDNNRRSADVNYVTELFKSNEKEVIFSGSPNEINKRLIEWYHERKINRKDLIILTGSTYVVGELLKSGITSMKLIQTHRN